MEPGFKIKDYLKDLRLIMEAAADVKMPLVETAVVQQMYKSLEADGHIHMGTQAVIKAVEKLAGETLV
jgi:3-hydroxyisobutyrate dehydrogenase